MPRARRRCAKPDCRYFQPCPIKEHQRGWAASKSGPLPGNWGRLKKLVRSRSGGRCEKEWKIAGETVRCPRPAVQVDHIINRARWPKGKPGLHGFHPDKNHPTNNLQDLCKPCHDAKTAYERKLGRKK